jgi:hypothetical protein
MTQPAIAAGEHAVPMLVEVRAVPYNARQMKILGPGPR